MNPFELILVSLAIIAGTFVATFTTIACFSALARRKRDRQIIRAYLEDPKEVEMWLAEGAIELLERTVSRHRSEAHRVSAARKLPHSPVIFHELAGRTGALIGRAA